MSTEKYLEKLVELTKVSYNDAVKDWKKKGGKVIGFACSYVPEEIIYAAGALPVRVRPVGCTEVPSANVYMTDLHCTFARGCLEFILKGEFDFLDGLVWMNSCDHIRRIYDILEGTGKKFPFMHFLSVPYVIRDDAVEWYKEEIKGLKKNLEVFMGVKITKEKLKDSVNVYNETRSLLKKLYSLRKQEKPPVNGTVAMSITLGASAAPKPEYNQMLKGALEEISGLGKISNYRARLMITGSALDDTSFVGTIEDLGGLVCTDALCFGSRYFWEPVKPVNTDDLIGGLAKSYLNRPSCARMVHETAKKMGYLEEMIKDYKIDGVIHQRIRYCDLWGSDLLFVRKALEKMNIPLLALEKEYWPTGAGQLRTRVQAFLEAIEARR